MSDQNHPLPEDGDEPAGAPDLADAVDLTILERTSPDPSAANDAFVAWTAAIGGVLAVGFAVGLRVGAPLTLYGSLLALSCFSLGLAVRRYFFDRFPEIIAAQPRESPGADVERLPDVVGPLPRRNLLTRILISAFGLLGISLLALVPSLGPGVGQTLRRTPWARGVRLVTTDGEPLGPGDVPVGGITTVWPEGNVGFERASVVVIRLDERPEEPTNLSWVVDETLVAYSKICTHAGCPVALYRQVDESLFCPCHQSTFDVLHGCVPTFGPAARALPQLPLGVDDDGMLIAQGDFEAPPGPSFG